uniref:ATP citrate synthase n=1 Tax=Opuntia streptacantha TaxID=393608 RepID=A0A7C8YXC6_OPUST
MSPTESFIQSLDEKTTASLKFTVLNPKGRIWTMVAGGGASVIYADTVGDLGYASELGNYAEYSGAPKEEEVLQYARVVIDCATANPDGRKRALVIGGGISNFTDVASTFNGIIQALKEKEAKLKAARMHIYVRRGGPNYQKGLAKMRMLGEEIGIPIEVYGPEATMTGICKQAIDCISAAA